VQIPEEGVIRMLEELTAMESAARGGTTKVKITRRKRADDDDDEDDDF